MNRTKTYFDTIETQDPQFQSTIDLIRSTLHKVNKHNRTYGGQQFFLRVRGRLGKNNPYADLYKPGGKHYQPCAQDINIGHARRADLYISTRSR